MEGNRALDNAVDMREQIPVNGKMEPENVNAEEELIEEEAEGNEPLLWETVKSLADGSDVNDDEYDDDFGEGEDVGQTREGIHTRRKRSPWAGSEMRYDKILDMLRSSFHPGTKKRISHTHRWFRNGVRRSRTRRDLTYLDMPNHYKKPIISHLMKNTPQDMAHFFSRHNRPKPSDLHPFVGGIGDYAAEMALGTYAKLLRTEFDNRLALGDTAKTTRNVRPFVG